MDDFFSTNIVSDKHRRDTSDPEVLDALGIDSNTLDAGDRRVFVADHKVQYKISMVRECISSMMVNGSSNLLDKLKDTLNKLFGTTGCQDIIYTKNTDKSFFGIYILPIIPSKDIFPLFQSDEKYIIKDYYVELDSKLFNTSTLGLNAVEITAILIHEIGALIIDSSPIEKVRANIDDYLVRSDEIIKLTDSVNYLELLTFGIKDALRKVTSVFEAELSDIVTQFDKVYGISNYLGTAMGKVQSSGYNPNNDVDNKVVVLSWVLRIYKDVLNQRIVAIHSLNRCIELSGSKLESKEMYNIISRLERIDDGTLLESFVDTIFQSLKQVHSKMKINGIKQYDDDYYEFTFEMNNLENSDDAMLLLHRINSRMAVIDDFLSSEEMNKESHKRWTDLYNRFNILRGTLSKNKFYSNKTRLYVNYGIDD